MLTFGKLNVVLCSVFLIFYSYGPKSILAEGPPRKLAIADDERITFAQANQSIVLKCPIEMTEYQTFVDWFKGNMSLYMEKGYELTHKGTLKIKLVTKHHAGTYTCEGINGHGTVRVNITLIVDNPEVEDTKNNPANPNSANRIHGFPPLIKKRASTHFVDDVGGQATFHCVASGEPTPHIFWLKDGHLIEASENDVRTKGKAHSTLKVRGLKKSDAGIYKCIARNNKGESHMDFSLEVTDPSSPPRIIALEPPNVTIKEGATAVFWCEVDSRPGLKLHIKWLKKVFKEEIGHSTLSNDLTLFRSGTTYYRPLNFSDGTTATDGVYKSKLLIRNTEKEDSGTYVCLALNDKGFSFKNVTLTVIGTVKTVPNTSSYFANSSTTLVVIVIIAFVTFLSAVILGSRLCCRGKSSQKGIINNTTAVDTEAGKPSQAATSVRKPMKKDFIPYIEVRDPHSASKLLCSDTNYIYDYCEDQVSRTSQVKSYAH
ncbi:fibroblast growth factor receptor-like 1 [Uloborus diversus]|uniref:fibroblast growth factor receptor-like 1 n=1 Tax=Uloborus diversus TaxID=327109 RepID=UPI00240A49E9|nr:fibroblast growth factor receptor-like 1 [Uloborus diversus]